LKRRATVQLSGLLIVTNSKRNETWYQNARLRLVDRTMDYERNCVAYVSPIFEEA
jgi:hypothetical protein